MPAPSRRLVLVSQSIRWCWGSSRSLQRVWGGACSPAALFGSEPARGRGVCSSGIFGARAAPLAGSRSRCRRASRAHEERRNHVDAKGLGASSATSYWEGSRIVSCPSAFVSSLARSLCWMPSFCGISFKTLRDCAFISEERCVAPCFDRARSASRFYIRLRRRPRCYRRHTALVLERAAPTRGAEAGNAGARRIAKAQSHGV